MKSLSELNEGLPEDYREQKYQFDLEELTRKFLQAGGDAKMGAALLGHAMCEVMGVAVTQEVQNEMAQALAWCVSEIQQLKGEDVPDVVSNRDDEGTDAVVGETEDGEDEGDS